MTTATPRLVHATAIALGPAAALIRGASGSGKSDLALRCIGMAAGGVAGETAILVSDDQVVLSRDASGIVVSPPPAIAGRLEVRGLGIVEVAYVDRARLALVVDLVAPDVVERLPPELHCLIDDVRVPVLQLTPFEASAPLKLLLCLRRVMQQNP